MTERMLTVPIRVFSADELPDYARRLHAAGAKRVFLCCLPHWVEDSVMDKELELHRTYAEYLSAEGFEVGLWLHAFGFGVPLTEPQKKICAKFTKIRDLRGRVAGEAFCPTSEDFCVYMERLVEKSAALPISLLMLDDDFCQSVRPGIGCACDAHLAELRRLAKDDSLSVEVLNQRLFYEKDKSLRKIWFDLQGKTMADFAKRMRDTVDRVNPSLRFGFCAGYTSWDFEGISAPELTKILAGNTPPFLRTTGAPYWVATNRNALQLKLQDIVELTRMQREWSEGLGIEMFDENDNYPRIPTFVPAAYQEGFDLAMAVDGKISPFKYLFSYQSGTEYNEYYYDAHLRNRETAEWLRAAAEGKQDVGVRVREYRDKAREYDYFPEDEETFGAAKAQMCAVSFPRSHCIATRNAIPTVWGQAKAEIIFGENAKYIPLDELPQGAILDIRAAEILHLRGVDVGLADTCIDYEKMGATEYMTGEPPIELWNTNRIGRVTLKEHAEVLSVADTAEEQIPCSYRYENAKGQRFLVYCFDASSLNFSSNLFCHAGRRRQLNAHLDWLGADVPFRVEGNHPNLYALCKRGEDGSLLIALFNFTPDEQVHVAVRIPEGISGKELRTRGVRLRAEQDRLVIDEIKAYGFAAVEILPKHE